MITSRAPVAVEDLSHRPIKQIRLRWLQTAEEVGIRNMRMLDTNEEPRRPVVSGERPELYYSTLYAGTHCWVAYLIPPVWLLGG